MLAKYKRRKIPILMYHSISHSAAAKFKKFTVSPTVFANQMAYLYQQAYTPITVSQFIHMRSQVSSALPERPVVITFDDGFADFYREVLPVLKQYSFTATLYVATAFVDDTSRWLQHEGEATRPMLTWEQLTEISEYGIECGAHSHSHPQLDILPKSLSYNEIVQSKRILEHHLGRQISSFAYPFGYHTAMIRRQVREAGYTSACAVKYTMSSESTDPFALTRLIVGADLDLNTFAALVSGRSSYSLRMLYARARTPLWQVALRSLALLKRPLQGVS